MRTINISLPDSFADKIFQEVKKGGFASVSEYVRSLIRRQVMSEEDFEFEVFEKKPLREIRRDFERTGLYNKKFIDSVVKGLSQSSIYASKATKK